MGIQHFHDEDHLEGMNDYKEYAVGSIGTRKTIGHAFDALHGETLINEAIQTII